MYPLYSIFSLQVSLTLMWQIYRDGTVLEPAISSVSYFSSNSHFRGFRNQVFLRILSDTSSSFSHTSHLTPYTHLCDKAVTVGSDLLFRVRTLTLVLSRCCSSSPDPVHGVLCTRDIVPSHVCCMRGFVQEIFLSGCLKV